MVCRPATRPRQVYLFDYRELSAVHRGHPCAELGFGGLHRLAKQGQEVLLFVEYSESTVS